MSRLKAYLALGLCISAHVLENSIVFVVRIDACKLSAIHGGNTFNVYSTFALLAAVST